MADVVTPTKRAAAFMAANRESRVTDGFITSAGMTYILEDGTTYKLDDRDVVTIPDRAVRWLHD